MEQEWGSRELREMLYLVDLTGVKEEKHAVEEFRENRNGDEWTK